MILKRGIGRGTLMALVGALVMLPACTALGGTRSGGDGPSLRSGTIVGEVRSVDTRRDRIVVREYDGDMRTVRYDRRTRVVDGHRQYSVSRLSRGDDVRIRVEVDRHGTLWAERVELRGHDRDRRWGDRDDRRDGRWSDRRVERLTGTVGMLEAKRRLFTLDVGRSGTVVVRVPDRLDRDDARRVERLRRGDRVHVDVRPLSGNTVELVRFR